MKHGICLLTLAQMRSEPRHTSELVSQLLFGETFEVIEKMGDWIQVRLIHDHYIGWVNSNQISIIAEAAFEEIQKKPLMICARNFVIINSLHDNSNYTLSAGSSLPGLDGGVLAIGNKKFKYSDELIENLQPSGKQLTNYAKIFLNTPYLWGGRSCFGIDCSGLMQVVFKMAGVNIPRDASVQVSNGKSIDLLVEAQPGDILFFDDEEQRITHVGMLVEEGQIIHAFGKVRIDPVDHHGIFNKDLKRYTHNLRIIKRLV